MTECQICGKSFVSKSRNPNVKYCGYTCQKKAFANRRRERRQQLKALERLKPIPKHKPKHHVSIQSIEGIPCFGCELQHLCDSRFCLKLDEWLQND